MKNTAIAFLGSTFLLVVIMLFANSLDRMKLSYSEITDLTASLFFAKGISTDQLQESYKETSPKKVKILVMPGHFPYKGGAEFKDAIERDMAVALGKNLVDFLSQNEKFEVILGRDEKSFNSDIETYINKNKEKIEKWRNDHKKEMETLIKGGEVKDADGVDHNSISSADALFLYGINYWANENGIDMVINIHMNDYPRKKQNLPGEYYGFAVYVPEKQYGNSESSKALGEAISKRLEKFLPNSTLPKESKTVVPDQDLIAIGRYNTAKTASVLIEYGYIYEPFYSSEELRKMTLRELAYQTFVGIEEFFGENRETLSIVSNQEEFKANDNPNKASAQNLLLQFSLILSGFYPPEKKTLEECPLTGVMGNCTKEALKNFQKENELKITGLYDEDTAKFFNENLGAPY